VCFWTDYRLHRPLPDAGPAELGLLLTMILGIVGSFAGGFIASLFSGRSDSLVNPSGWIMSTIGALVVLFVYSKIAKPKA
jgi:uncharacterized membrane protein YeaQ/YmgE (transglycosylase-associated protein family)